MPLSIAAYRRLHPATRSLFAPPVSSRLIRRRPSSLRVGDVVMLTSSLLPPELLPRKQKSPQLERLSRKTPKPPATLRAVVLAREGHRLTVRYAYYPDVFDDTMETLPGSTVLVSTPYDGPSTYDPSRVRHKKAPPKEDARMFVLMATPPEDLARCLPYEGRWIARRRRCVSLLAHDANLDDLVLEETTLARGATDSPVESEEAFWDAVLDGSESPY